MQILKKNIEELISRGDIENALKLLGKELSEKDDKLHDEVVQLQGHYRNIVSKQRTQTASVEEISIQKNKLVDSILSILNELDERPLKVIEDEKTSPNFRMAPLINSIAFLLGLLVLYEILSYFKSCVSSRKEDQTEVISGAHDSLPPNDRKALNDKVEKIYYDEIEPIYNEYQSIYVGGATKSPSVLLDKADILDSELKKIDPSKLDPYNLILRAMGLTVIYKIRAILTTTASKKLDYSQKALRYASELKSALNAVENLSDARLKTEVTNWIQDNRHHLRADINIFIAETVNHLSGGEVSISKIKNDYETLKGSLVEEGYLKYPVLHELYTKYPQDFPLFK